METTGAWKLAAEQAYQDMQASRRAELAKAVTTLLGIELTTGDVESPRGEDLAIDVDGFLFYWCGGTAQGVVMVMKRGWSGPQVPTASNAAELGAALRFLGNGPALEIVRSLHA